MATGKKHARKATGNHAHKMTLEEKRALVVKDFVKAEENFEAGSVSGGLFEFFKWLDKNTDTFDHVMIEATLEMDDVEHPPCKATHTPRILHFSEDEMKDMVNQFLNQSLVP